MQPASRFSTVTADLIVPTFTSNVKVGQPPRAGLRGPQEAEMHVVRVNILSGDDPVHVGSRRKGALTRGRSRPRSVEGNGVARLTPHEAVIRADRVDLLSRNLAPQVDALRYGALAGAIARGRNIECGDVAGPIAREAVIHAVRINVVCRGCPEVVDA